MSKKVFGFSISDVRSDFPILGSTVKGKPLVYLDSAASAQKPFPVIEHIRNQYLNEYSNVHRGAYYLSGILTEKFEESRRIIQSFINAKSAREIIFTKGATEAINLVSNTLSGKINNDSEILITALEHHSNIVPWQMLCERTGASLKVAPIEQDGSVTIDSIKKCITKKTRIISVAHVSNVLGTILPLKEIASLAHSCGAKLMVDGCQGIVHQMVDVQEIDCDFYAFSGHKLYGPNGIGVLFGKEEILDGLPPYQGGGDMISNVTFEKSEWADLPAKFEAGTPPIVPAIGLGVAVKYFSSFDRRDIDSHEKELMKYSIEKLLSINGIRLFGTSEEKCAVISFLLEGVHPHDLATVLDNSGICVRAGHHCAQPLMDILGIPGTVRASLAMYNDRNDIDILVDAISHAKRIFL